LAPIALVGLTLALTTGPANMLGAMVGGWLADRRGPNDPRAYLSVPAVAVVFQLPLYIPALLVGNIVLCVALLAANAFVSTFYYGPQYAAIQAVVKPQMRATATAMYGMLTTLFGLGLGPLLVGALSDYLATSGGLGPANGLRWAMIASLTFYPLTFLFFWLARSRIRTDMER
jgi:MFS family permease